MKNVTLGVLIITGMLFSSMIINTGLKSQSAPQDTASQPQEQKPVIEKVPVKETPKTGMDSLKLSADSLKTYLIKGSKRKTGTIPVLDNTHSNLRQANNNIDDVTPVLQETPITEAGKKPVVLDSVKVAISDSVVTTPELIKKKGFFKRVSKFLHL